MKNPTRREAIAKFLWSETHADLASLYSQDMEVQVNVLQAGGVRTNKEYKGRNWSVWTDGINEWKSFRIPYNANTIPEYTDVPMSFDLTKYVEGIGLTGWDWKNQESVYVAFDFDAISGHENHIATLSSEEMKRVEIEASKIPWVTVRKSTSGKGLHLYVFLEPTILTANHTEHAALARAILGQMSALTGYPFNAKVDACGSILWIWHRKMLGTDGLTLIKKGQPLHVNEIPHNWRDHIKVITGKSKRTLPTFMEESQAQAIDDLTNNRNIIPLDDEHKKLIDFLQENHRGRWFWNSDHNMLITHTFALKDAFESLNMKGLYDTIAEGKDIVDINCFAFPMRKGAWSCRRYTKGVKEAPTWDQDSSGWTRCYLNREPDFKLAARVNGGLEHPKGGFIFQQAELAVKCALILGVEIEIPPWSYNKEAKLIQNKDGRLIVELNLETRDTAAGGIPGFLLDKRVWKKIYSYTASTPENEVETTSIDDVVRHIVDASGDDAGWTVKVEETWNSEPLVNVKHALASIGYGSKDVNMMIGTSIFQCWKIVNKPFESEYPGGREWNRRACQLAFQPNNDIENLKSDTWTMVLNHVGSGLDETVKSNEWCHSNGIICGGDYLKLWAACCFQRPMERLPYLFFYGPQGGGKSSFHEALSILLKNGKGYVRADKALTNSGGFNGELEGSIICVVEEVNMQRNKKVYDIIKDMVTAKNISIHHKWGTPFLSPNSTHWIQCANEFDACPIFPGDTRITMCLVPDLPKDPPPLSKRQLFVQLEKEAPDFLGEIMNIEIPEFNDRLIIPVLSTEDKLSAELSNRSYLQMFIDERCFNVLGSMISVNEFHEKFNEWLPQSEKGRWSKIRIGRELPAPYIKGKSAQFSGQHFYGNMAWELNENGQPLKLRSDGFFYYE